MQLHFLGSVEPFDVQLVPVDEILQKLSVYCATVHFLDVVETNGILDQLKELLMLLLKPLVEGTFVQLSGVDREHLVVNFELCRLSIAGRVSDVHLSDLSCRVASGA